MYVARCVRRALTPYFDTPTPYTLLCYTRATFASPSVYRERSVGSQIGYSVHNSKLRREAAWISLPRMSAIPNVAQPSVQAGRAEESTTAAHLLTPCSGVLSSSLRWRWPWANLEPSRGCPPPRSPSSRRAIYARSAPAAARRWDPNRSVSTASLAACRE